MLRTDHTVFPVWDAEASLAFYRDVMGFALVETYSGPDWGGYAWLMMIFAPGDGREVVLVHLKGMKRPPRGKLPRDVLHMAFAESTVARLEGWRRKLKAAKIAFWEESHGCRRSLYFEDPNGMILEITAPPSRAAARERPKALAAARSWIARA